MTNYIHRLIIIIPASRQSAFNTFFKNNIDTVGGERTFSVGLNYSGLASSPITHYWAGISLTDIELGRIMIRLAQLSGISEPSNWDSMTRLQKLSWVLDNRVSILSAIGVRIFRDDIDGEWTRGVDALTEHSILRAEN